MTETPKPAERESRSTWERWLFRIAQPVLEPLSQGRLRAVMPVEAKIPDRDRVTHLEAVGRLLAGLAPWLEQGKGERVQQLREWAVGGLSHAVDPASPDHLNFAEGRQPLVDAAFLAQGLLRAPTALIASLTSTTRDQLVTALGQTRSMLPVHNNWLLFSATVEAALCRLGVWWDPMRVDYALRQHEQWYVGDGHYSDGAAFHWDYYNSFVIHPMLVDVIRTLGPGPDEVWAGFREPLHRRARRYAAVLERLVSPEGTLPPIGRSLAYRFGALQALAQAVLHQDLPEELPAAQARGAMAAAIERMIHAPGTFDADGYLRIGFCGHQPSIGEGYISTGSLYLCANAFLPLGLGVDQAFWADPPTPWTQVRIYGGEDLPADHAAG